MSEDVSKLERLYLDGKELFEFLNDKFTKNSHLFEEMSYAERLMISPFASRDPKPLPQATKSKMDEFEKRTISSAEQWREKVAKELGKSAPRVRYRLSFNDIKTNIYKDPIRRPSEQGKRIVDCLNELESRLNNLYTIIAEIDRLGDNVEPRIQRASYDPAKRILYFAGEEIRFYSNSIYPPEICRVMFADLKKESWKLSEFLHLWDITLDRNNAGLKDWQRVQDIIRKLNGRIKKRTKISNLFILKDKTVHLNKNYID